MPWDIAAVFGIFFTVLLLFFLPTLLHRATPEDFVAVAFYFGRDTLEKARDLLHANSIVSTYDHNKHPSGVQRGPSCLRVMRKDLPRARQILNQDWDLQSGVK